jgi:hypothetical protein
MLNKLKKLFAKKSEPTTAEEPKKPKVQKPKVKELSEKEKATANNEPYVAITKIELDPNDVNNGYFELDYNDKFVLNLIRAGYKLRNDDTDEIIVDRWYQTISRNIALELFEQQQADPDRRDVRYQLQTRKLDNGRTEIS